MCSFVHLLTSFPDGRCTCEFCVLRTSLVAYCWCESRPHSRGRSSALLAARKTAACCEVTAVLSRHHSTLGHLRKKTMQRSAALSHRIAQGQDVLRDNTYCNIPSWVAIPVATRGHTRPNARWLLLLTEDPRARKKERTQDLAHARPCARETARSWWCTWRELGRRSPFRHRAALPVRHSLLRAVRHSLLRDCTRERMCFVVLAALRAVVSNVWYL